MNRKPAVLVVVILLAAASGLTYYAWNSQAKPVPTAEPVVRIDESKNTEQVQQPKQNPSVEALVYIGDPAVVLVVDPKNIDRVNAFIQQFKSEPVLLNAARRISQSKSLPADVKDRAAYLADRFDASRADAKEGKGSNAIRLSFRDDDTEMAKEIINNIILAFPDEMKALYEEANKERIQRLKNAIQQNNKKTEENLVERDETISKMRKVSTENPEVLEQRYRKAMQMRKDLENKLQEIIATTPDKAANYQSEINEISRRINQDGAILKVILPLKAKVEALEKSIDARTKLVDGYEAELLQADLTRAMAGSIKVIILQSPMVAKP